MSLFHRLLQKVTRRPLRTHGTSAEAVLWTRLKGRRLAGFRWRRQVDVGPYVLDFYCPAVRLAVELDEAAHQGPAAQEAGAARARHLAAVGIRVLRFENRAVVERPDEVLAAILTACI